ncbi:CRISPR-associated endonuclease Cas1 [Suttonella ornithocola]|uniref:CRISPR-associated endonuclease Cas1 n=2 Tax=Suttonella ornithocola TaxID=279832 RepID=A0A380MYF9_9GAMM|nr:CRISPR-associated endonuclease Cas1 [Suttonella ornithocola]
MRKTLIQYQDHDTKILEQQQRNIAHADTIDTLRGYEGTATHDYYQHLGALLKKTPFQFTHRNRRPPKDPFNVLLSYGYQHLYQYLHSLLLSLSLNPDRGYMHRSQSKHIALCSDLIEPFRHLIERAAITVIRRKQIRPEHFYYRQDACYLTGEGSQTYSKHLSRLFETRIGHADINKPRYIECLYKQAVSFKRHLQAPEKATFTAYRE